MAAIGKLLHQTIHMLLWYYDIMLLWHGTEIIGMFLFQTSSMMIKHSTTLLICIGGSIAILCFKTMHMSTTLAITKHIKMLISLMGWIITIIITIKSSSGDGSECKCTKWACHVRSGMPGSNPQNGDASSCVKWNIYGDMYVMPSACWRYQSNQRQRLLGVMCGIS